MLSSSLSILLKALEEKDSWRARPSSNPVICSLENLSTSDILLFIGSTAYKTKESAKRRGKGNKFYITTTKIEWEE